MEKQGVGIRAISPGEYARTSADRLETAPRPGAYDPQDRPWRHSQMLRTIFTIGLFALLGLFALKLVFGILGGLFVVVWMLLRYAITIAIIGFVIYLVIRIFSPETARRMRERFSGSSY